ncbi:MAG: preprotein translocase subunit SecG [Planctomycetota bacterium]
MLTTVSLFAFVGFLKSVLLFLFVVTALLLIVVVLLQEGKGGGLAGAFGGAGAETFGVQTGSVNRFTATVAGAFVVIAILFAAIKPEIRDVSALDQPAEEAAPADPGAATPGGATRPGETGETEQDAGG